MTVKTGQAWAGTFVTLDATGALATPSSSPAGALYVDGVANAATVTITGSNPYKWAVTLPTLTAGQRVDMYITATIATIGTAGIVASEQADTFITSDIETLVDGLETMLTDIHDTDLPAVKTAVDAILVDTGTTLPATLATLAGYTDGIAGDVWSHAHRTLTNQGIDATSPASGDPLIIYRDTTVYISLTGLGDTTGAAATKIFFTAKENLEDADSDSIIQLKCTRATPITDPDTDDLLYINKAAPTAATEGTFVFADHTDGTAEISIDAVAAADLPIYAATPLYWDVKMVTAAGVSTILSTGSMYIYGTPTRTIA